jgi:outer membrane receptor protein involved in Fe transport
VGGNENNRHQANANSRCLANGGNGRPGYFACGNGKLDAYAVVNLDTQYNIGKGWSAFAKAINIFVQDYNVSGRLAETMFGPSGGYGAESNVRGLLPGAPRAAWIGFRYEFGGAPEAN